MVAKDHKAGDLFLHTNFSVQNPKITIQPTKNTGQNLVISPISSYFCILIIFIRRVPRGVLEV